MRIDLYTKSVLTVIALSLIWLSLGGPALLPTIHAQRPGYTSGYDRVIIAGWVDEVGLEHRLPGAVPGSGVPVVSARSTP